MRENDEIKWDEKNEKNGKVSKEKKKVKEKVGEKGGNVKMGKKVSPPTSSNMTVPIETSSNRSNRSN